MDTQTLFIVGLGVSLLASLTVAVYIRTHLRSILVEVCGTQTRADFWITWSNIPIVVLPLTLTLLRGPGSDSALTRISYLIGVSLTGLLAVIIAMGIVLTVFISDRKEN